MDQIKAAAARALYGAVLTAALTFIVTLQGSAIRDGAALADAGLAAGVTFFGYLVTRGVAEGVIDAYRNGQGLATKADVGQG